MFPTTVGISWVETGLRWPNLRTQLLVLLSTTTSIAIGHTDDLIRNIGCSNRYGGLRIRIRISTMAAQESLLDDIWLIVAMVFPKR